MKNLEGWRDYRVDALVVDQHPDHVVYEHELGHLVHQEAVDHTKSLLNRSITTLDDVKNVLIEIVSFSVAERADAVAAVRANNDTYFTETVELGQRFEANRLLRRGLDTLEKRHVAGVGVWKKA